MTSTVRTETLAALTVDALTLLANDAAALVAADPRKSFSTKAEAIARLEKHLETAKEAGNEHDVEMNDSGAKLVKVVVENNSDSTTTDTASGDTTTAETGSTEGTGPGTTAEVKDIAKERKSRKGVETARAAFKNDHFIRVLVANPKRPNSPAFERFSNYKDGMTVAEFCAAIGRRAALIDLAYDVSRKFVLVQEVLSDDFKETKEEPTVSETDTAPEAPTSTETVSEQTPETQEAAAA